MIDVISRFYVKADENVYCFAMKQCTKNDFDKNNIGILSIYYIDEKNWHTTYIYGSSEWTPGINFEEYKIVPN